MKQALEISATDGFPLPAILVEPSTSSKGIILLCPGLGIPKEFYERYVDFLGQQGYTTLVFDYRGINLEDKELANKDSVNLRNWGIKDMVGATNWLHQQYPQQKLYLFGHSIAGQVAGLMENHVLINRYFFFCSTTGHHSVFDASMSAFSWFMFHVHIPITSRIFGYMPPSLTYRGVSIAKGVALEWARWSRKRDYISAFFGKTIEQQYYTDIKKSIDWIYFKDDPIATQKAVGTMMEYYPNATITHHHLTPTEMGLPRIGHSGFFTRKAEKIWAYPLELIEGKTKYS